MNRRPDLRVLQTTGDPDDGDVAVVYDLRPRLWIGLPPFIVPRSWFALYMWHANGCSLQTRYVGASAEALERLRRVVCNARYGIRLLGRPPEPPGIYQAGDEFWGGEPPDVFGGVELGVFIDPRPHPERFPVRRSVARRLFGVIRRRA